MSFPITPLLVLFSIVWIIIRSYSTARRSSKLPPGPTPYPIIGNILDLGPNPHHSLTKLSREYGPLMSLQLGSITTIVVSSREAAKLVFQKHDLSLSSRTLGSAVTSLKHNEFSPAWLPIGDQWRKLRKICKEQLFSASRLDSGQGLRREKLHKLLEYVKMCGETGRAVNVGEAAFTTTLNLVSESIFSMEFAEFDSDSLQEIKDAMWQVMYWVGKPNVADYFPFLKPVDPLGIFKQAEFYFGKVSVILEEIVNDRLRSRDESEKKKKNDMVEALIDINQRDEGEINLKDINHLLIDLIIAGTETTSGTVEWAMAELLRVPEKMSRLRDEIKTVVVGENGLIREEDVSRLPYLQAVVKEAFRLHPPLPFLLPRKAVSDVEINGYLVPKNAQILVNVWAIGRDPSMWENADSFVPERFLNHNGRTVEFRGQDFELIPFGAGRRICPGLPLADRMVHLMVAALVGNFEWRVEEEIEMEEKFGLSVVKATPITAIPTYLE